MIRIHDVRCVVCHGGVFDHDRTSGECLVYRRAEVKPVVYRARPQAGAPGWQVRPA